MNTKEKSQRNTENSSGFVPTPVGANLCVRPDSRIHACGTWADTQVCPYWDWPSYAFFISAGRVSPRRATGFLARARKSAKKACCAAWRHRTHFAPTALRSDNYGESDGKAHAGYRRCALMDAPLLGGRLCLLRSFSRCSVAFNSCYRRQLLNFRC